MKKQKLNVRLLRRIQNKILAEPSQFNMAWWFQNHDALGNRPANCGTAACIAGWAVALSVKAKPSELLGTCAGNKGQALLRLDKTESDSLFGVADWPERFREQYDTAKTPRAAARAAARYIDHFIKEHAKK